MNNKILLLLALSASASMMSLGCKKDPEPEAPASTEVTADVYATYNYPTNGTPVLTIDRSAGRLPDIVKIPVQQSTSYRLCEATKVCLDLTNVRFTQNGKAYILDEKKSETQEQLSTGFVKDPENFLTYDKARSLDFVLVLDLSSSLGPDVAKVKEYAKAFIDQISQKSTGAKVALVVFSGTIVTLPLSNNFTAAKTFIDSQSNGTSATKLFEAVDRGLTLLASSSAEGKAIMTFTDGFNNSYSDPNKYQTINYLLSRLNTPINGSSVSSYAIGLNGTTNDGAREAELNQLALNGGITEIAKDASVLETVFSKFATSVSSVYTLTYKRDDSRQARAINLRFHLVMNPM